MATSLADSPPSQESEPQDAGHNGSGAAPDSSAHPDAPRTGTSCAKCGAALAPGQDWCLQCGAGAPGSVGSGAWRPWAIALAATAVLLLGAAAAAYAALSKEPKHAAVVTATVAQAPPPAATAPAPASTPTPTPTIPATKVPPIAKAPVLPTKAVTPPVTTPTTPATPTGGTTGEQKTSTTGSGQGTTAPKGPTALLLDTNAASTYNPYNYPATSFGDPSLTIDGDTGTGWSAQVNPATAPAMAEGVVLDLKSAKKLSAVKLVTSTPGMTLQIYGANTKTAPASITDTSWVPISHSLRIGKRRARIPLKTQGKPYRFVVVWISGAPESSVGTPEAPGKVTLNEIELFPAG
jgi:hypothetical protein